MDQSAISPDEPERWLPVPGYEGLYEVSSLGRIESFHHERPRILKPIRRYHYGVSLIKDGQASQRTVHSIVAEAFIGPRPPGLEVCHGPGGRYDNRLVNLSYGTHAKNIADMRRDGTMLTGTRVHFAKLTDEVVMECRARAAAGERLADLACEFGVSLNAIYCAVSGRTWRHLPLVRLPPRTPSAAARIAAYLEGQIKSGELAAGSRLPPLKGLARRYGVGMSTASNAVTLLRKRGLVAGRTVAFVAGPPAQPRRTDGTLAASLAAGVPLARARLAYRSSEQDRSA